MLRDERCLRPGDEFVTLRLIRISNSYSFYPHRFSSRSEFIFSILVPIFLIFSSILILSISVTSFCSGNVFLLPKDFAANTFLSVLFGLDRTGPTLFPPKDH